MPNKLAQSIILVIILSQFSVLALLFFQYALRSSGQFYGSVPGGTNFELNVLMRPNVSTQALLQWATLAATATYTLNFVSYDSFPVFDVYMGDGPIDDKQMHLDNFYIKHKSRLLNAVLDTYNSDNFRVGKLSTLVSRNWLVRIFFANMSVENLEKYVELDEMMIPQKITPLGAQKILEEVGYLVPYAE